MNIDYYFDHVCVHVVKVVINVGKARDQWLTLEICKDLK